MTERWTIRRVLSWMAEDFAGRGLDSPRLDAELLLAHALELERVGLYLDLDRPLGAGELDRIRGLVKRRRAREPVAYILGRREFYKSVFEVSPAVLVPRPETETLVERALAVLPEGVPARALDLCTGSGVVAVSLAAEREPLHVDATDVAAEALEVARRNAERHGVAERVAFYEGDLFAPLPGDATYALIVANPPYVADADLGALEPEITEHEPRVALAAGPRGLAVIERIASEVARRLEPGGHVLLEVGAGQAPAVVRLLEQAGLEGTRAHADLAGVERVVEGRRPAG